MPIQLGRSLYHRGVTDITGNTDATWFLLQDLFNNGLFDLEKCIIGPFQGASLALSDLFQILAMVHPIQKQRVFKPSARLNLVGHEIPLISEISQSVFRCARR